MVTVLGRLVRVDSLVTELGTLEGVEVAGSRDTVPLTVLVELLLLSFAARSGSCTRVAVLPLSVIPCTLLDAFTGVSWPMVLTLRLGATVLPLVRGP